MRSAPSMIRPLSCGTSPAIVRNNVVLPQPEEPMTVNVRPASTSSATSCNTDLSPYRTASPSTINALRVVSFILRGLVWRIRYGDQPMVNQQTKQRRNHEEQCASGGQADIAGIEIFE